MAKIKITIERIVRKEVRVNRIDKSRYIIKRGDSFYQMRDNNFIATRKLPKDLEEIRTTKVILAHSIQELEDFLEAQNNNRLGEILLLESLKR